MKKLKLPLIIFSAMLLQLTIARAQQVPQTLTYQSVLRNSSNALVANTAVGIKISILQGSASGSEIFSETQAATTNANGLLSLQIGAGNAVTGAFANIDWANGPYFIKTETDPTGGSNYSIVGTQQLLSVPYALYAAKSGGTVFETTADVPTDIHNINPGNVGIGTDLPSEKLDVAGNLKVRGNISNGGSNASGPYSIATGLNTTASGQYSTAMGESSVSNGYSTTALGIASTASGWGATAIGILSSAEGSASVALGSRAKAYSLSEIAVGQFNTAYALNTPTSTYEFNGADRIFVVGNGQDDNNLSDAMVVLKNGNTTINGDVTANSIKTPNGTSSQYLMADGSVSTSAAGPQGPQGVQGPAGNDGAVGPQGPQGVQGPAGNDGAVGPQGLQGVQGPAGNDGAVGPQGLQGLQGPAGNDGAVGPQGPAGSDATVSITSIANTSNPNGGTINMNTGALSLAPADDTNGGIVTTGAQTFAGNKTFTGTATANSFVKTGGTASQYLIADGSSSSIIRGTVASNGTVSNGTGFSSAIFLTGSYIITFNTPFTTIPIVVTTTQNNYSISSVTNVTTTGFWIRIVNFVSSGPIAATFNFIAMAP